MAETAYNVYKAGVLRADEDWAAGDYRALLLTGATTVDPDHATVDAILAVNTEANDASYGRVALTTKAVTQDDASDLANADADDIDFGALDNETPTAMVIFRQVTDDTDSVPTAFYDTNFGSAANGAGYTVTTPDGLLDLT